jgi:N-acetylmuramic acid 6-phosphate etherase
MRNVDLAGLVTESRNTNTLRIDELDSLGIVQLINEEDKNVPLAVERELPKIAAAIDAIVEHIQRGGRLIYMGAGTSGRLGILDASECPPTYGVSEELIQGIIAGGQEAIFRAKEGAEDSPLLGKEDLKAKNLSANDVVVGLAASGRTPYVIGGLDYANEIGAFTIAVTCNASSELSKIAKIAIAPIVGPEVVTGSTRLKSGTAQKLVLNMLSTGTMIQLGKVYGNLMVDVKATNEKLVERAKNIIMESTGTSRDLAEKYFEESHRDVKTAIVMIETGMSREASEAALKKHNGFIHKVIGGKH